MEMTSVENSQASTFSLNDVGHQPENMDPQLENHGEVETKCEITEEEVRGILEVIAATGKFWHEWDVLKSLLSLQLKQVLAEYPEAQMVSDQQTSSLGETYLELVKRLDDALLSFIEGPPFTLQRLCEILLTAKSIYPNLSKLALALEKNLLVASTLTICIDPYPSTGMIPKREESDKGSADPLAHSSPVQNGVEAMVNNKEEELVKGEEIEEDDKNVDKETASEEISGTSETNNESSGDSLSLSEQLNSTN